MILLFSSLFQFLFQIAKIHTQITMPFGMCYVSLDFVYHLEIVVQTRLHCILWVQHFENILTGKPIELTKCVQNLKMRNGEKRNQLHCANRNGGGIIIRCKVHNLVALFANKSTFMKGFVHFFPFALVLLLRLLLCFEFKDSILGLKQKIL